MGRREKKGGLGTLPIVPEQPRLFNFLILSLSVSLFSRRFSPLKEPLRRKEVLYAYAFNSIKSVSMGLTVSRQTATSSTVKKWEILPPTVKEAVAISRQRVLLFQISVFQLLISDCRLLKNLFNWYNRFPCSQIYTFQYFALICV